MSKSDGKVTTKQRLKVKAFLLRNKGKIKKVDELFFGANSVLNFKNNLSKYYTGEYFDTAVKIYDKPNKDSLSEKIEKYLLKPTQEDPFESKYEQVDGLLKKVNESLKELDVKVKNFLKQKKKEIEQIGKMFYSTPKMYYGVKDEINSWTAGGLTKDELTEEQDKFSEKVFSKIQNRPNEQRCKYMPGALYDSLFECKKSYDFLETFINKLDEVYKKRIEFENLYENVDLEINSLCEYVLGRKYKTKRRDELRLIDSFQETRDRIKEYTEKLKNSESDDKRTTEFISELSNITHSEEFNSVHRDTTQGLLLLLIGWLRSGSNTRPLEDIVNEVKRKIESKEKMFYRTYILRRKEKYGIEVSNKEDCSEQIVNQILKKYKEKTTAIADKLDEKIKKYETQPSQSSTVPQTPTPSSKAPEGGTVQQRINFFSKKPSTNLASSRNAQQKPSRTKVRETAREIDSMLRGTKTKANGTQ